MARGKDTGPVKGADGHSKSPQGRDLARLSLLALGVVYGDIGTSPLYALRECFHGPHGVDATQGNVLGVLSLIFWALVLIISIKYMIFITRADNGGEGGILALVALLNPRSIKPTDRMRRVLLICGLFGAALLFGDGMITPAISVLSAIEGLKVATTTFDPYVIPITIGILVLLFSIQSRGTAKVGAMFGPIIIIWFLTLGTLGLVQIVRNPSVLAAVNPLYGASFLIHNGWEGFLVLGSVFLVVTGGETLYADMGHMGPKPIRLCWYGFVLPALLLNYFGQGAWLSANPEAGTNTFYALAPSWGLYPLVGLATVATIIASQAVISGVYSLSMQAIQLGYWPRMQIDHTSESHFGQIYVGVINWALLASTITLVLAFGSSSALAAAYGVAVTMTMVITTMMFVALARWRWKWPLWAVGLFLVVFMPMELGFFGSNMMKVFSGGWVPLAVAAVLLALMTTWKRGRAILGERMRQSLMPLDAFLESLTESPPTRVPGTAVFMTGNLRNVPLALMHNLKHNHILHERVILLTIETEDVSRVPTANRVEIEALPGEFHQVIGHYGFVEQPHVPNLLLLADAKGLKYDPATTTFFLGRETLIPKRRRGLAGWREKLFIMMSRNAQSATTYFHIPPNRVIELGMQVEI